MVDARLLRRSFDSEVGANEIEDGEKRVPNARLAINLRVCKLLRAREMNFQHSPPPSSLRRETTAPPNPSSRTSTRTAPVRRRALRIRATARTRSRRFRWSLTFSPNFAVLFEHPRRRTTFQSERRVDARRQEATTRRRVRPTSNDFNLVATFGGVRVRNVKRSASELKSLR